MRISKLPLFRQFFLGLVMAALLIPGASHGQSVSRFKATIAITESIVPSGSAECFLTGSISGSGLASQLGKMTLLSTDCINPISQTTFLFSSNQVVLTAVNGDKIFAVYGGILTTEGTDGVITGGYQIVGGTGRFSHATGIGIVQGVEDLVTGEGEVRLTGTISY